jgi:hypothetical protein
MAQTTSVDRLLLDGKLLDGKLLDGKLLDAEPVDVSPLELPSLQAPALTGNEFTPTPYLWVKLRDLLSDCSYDEALLLCEVTVEPSENFDRNSEPQEWVAWVPDVGEVRLQRHQFYGRS